MWPELDAATLVWLILAVVLFAGETVVVLWLVLRWRKDRSALWLQQQTQRDLEIRLREQTQQMTTLKARLEELEDLDALCQIPNQRVLERQLGIEILRAQRNAQPLSVLLIDVDDFAAYREALGQAAADESLRRIGQLIKRCARRASDLAARMHGARFAVLLPESSKSAAHEVARIIRQAVAAVAIANPHSASEGILTLSIGVTILQESLGDLDARRLMEQAERTLQVARDLGGNRIEIRPI